jgi:hypothetical protein
MSVTNLYASVDQLAARVPTQFRATADDRTDEQTTAAENLLEAISRAIDSVTRREAGAFSPAATTPSAKVIYGNGKACLDVPAHIPTTVNPTITTISGVTPPKFAEYRGMLCITDDSGVLLRHEVWREGVPFTITARWGYQVTPADIREACLVWAAQRARMNSGDMAGMVTQITRDGATIQRDDIPPVVRDLLKTFILPETEDDHSGRVEFGTVRNSDFYNW